MHEYIHKLRRWRDKFEEKLDRRASHQNLEQFSPHLSDFRFQKFDEVEVPGQYLQHKDKNHDFIRIERFLPNVDLVRGVGVCHRRLKIRGHDGSIHAFAVQHPAARHCRREERIVQLFRIFNSILARKKESRRRSLNFHLPLMVPLAPHIRLVQDDVSYISLQGIYEDFCRRAGVNKDEPILFMMDKLRALSEIKPNVCCLSGFLTWDYHALTCRRNSINLPIFVWRRLPRSKRSEYLPISYSITSSRLIRLSHPSGSSAVNFLINWPLLRS